MPNQTVVARVLAPEQCAWRVAAWCEAVQISHAHFYREVRSGAIEVVKLGRATRVITPPPEYLRRKAGLAVPDMIRSKPRTAAVTKELADTN